MPTSMAILQAAAKARSGTEFSDDIHRRSWQEAGMRGNNEQQAAVFSYVNAEQRIAADHPLRRIRAMTEVALKELSPEFDRLYATGGRPSIAPEKLLRALLLQILYARRSERRLMKEMDYNLLFR